jgi:paraquat-inducible protein B
MSEREPEGFGSLPVAEAVVESRTRPSIIWVVPIVAVLVGGFVAWQAISERGPTITIQFATAEGLEAGKTKIKYKDVEVGLVEEIVLADDLSGVTVHAEMAKDFGSHLTDQTRFWVVKPRVAGGQVSGLGTLFSGAYIGVDPAKGSSARSFLGLDVAPIVTTDEPGRHFVLRSFSAGAVAVGTPVFYRKIRVGEVVSSELDTGGEFVAVRVFVNAPHDVRVRPRTRFWNASGFHVAMTAEGVHVDTESVASILIGGIAFDTDDSDAADAAADPEAVFTLYASREASTRPVYTKKITWLLYFDQSVRGLVPGSPVEFRGIRVGQVRDVRLEAVGGGEIRIPVIVDIEPERFGQLFPEKQRREAVQNLVALGLRAQLKSGNLLTGQLLINLDLHPNAEPAEIVWADPYPVMPTIPTPLDEITTDLTEIVQKIDRMPLEQIGTGLADSLTGIAELMRQINEDMVPRLTEAVEGADRTLAATSSMLGPDSALSQELPRLIQELNESARSVGLAADQIESEPESLIWGKK